MVGQTISHYRILKRSDREEWVRLPGHRPKTFQGESISYVLASVLKTEPDFSVIPATIHPQIGQLVRRCLQKDLRKRFQAIGDVRVEIEEVLADPDGVLQGPVSAEAPRVRRRAAPWIAAIVLAVLTGIAVGYLKPQPRYNVLMIAVDTLRANHLGTYGYEKPTSPRIDEFFESAVVFEDAHSTSSWTLPSFASLMTSVYSSTHGCWGFSDTLRPRFATLAEHLQQSGYHTAAAVSHVFMRRKYGLHQGFAFYDQQQQPGTLTR